MDAFPTWRDPETTIAYNADDSLCEAIIDRISKPNMGGMIILSTDVNAVKLSENKLVNWVKQKLFLLRINLHLIRNLQNWLQNIKTYSHGR